jgi:hypothetical protein
MRTIIIVLLLIVAGVVIWKNPSANIRFRSLIGQFFPEDSLKGRLANEQLLAVMGKDTIHPTTEQDFFDKLKTNTTQPVYVLRCLGKATRTNYLLVVDRAFFFKATIHQKFTPQEVSMYDVYSSEAELRGDVFHQRFQELMLK